MGKVPAAAVGLAVKVAKLVPAALSVAKDAVTPAGRPEAASVTGALIFIWALIVAMPWLLKPRGSASVPGRNDRAKLGAVTLMVTVAVDCSDPEVPVTTTGYVPAAARLLAVKISELVLLVLDALKAAVTPAGTPATFRLAAPLNPFSPVTVTVELTLLDCGSVRLAGDAARLKFSAKTVSCTAVLLLRLPEVPLMVIG